MHAAMYCLSPSYVDIEMEGGGNNNFPNDRIHEAPHFDACPGFMDARKTRCRKRVLRLWHNDAIEYCRARMMMLTVKLPLGYREALYIK